MTGGEGPSHAAPAEDIGRRAVSGIRWILILNAVTFPMSLATNLVLGNVSSVALGTYGAIQVFAEGFQALVVLGGANVFTRFVPALPPSRRWSFYVSYLSLVVGLSLVILSVSGGAAPGLVARFLDRLGGPPPAIAGALCLAALVSAFSSYFLYGDLDARAATITLRSVVAGYFVVSVGGVVFARGILASRPASYLWPASLAVYGAAALVGTALVLRTDAFSRRERLRLGFPAGFWEAVVYTHLQTLVAFAYVSLAPSVVLIWLDVQALGFLHAAYRFPALIAVLPVMMASVTGPAAAAHFAAGRRAEAFHQIGRALQGAWAAVVPSAIVLSALAPQAMRVFGAEFPAHRDLLRILAPSAVAAPMVFIGASAAVALHAFRDYFGASVLFLATTLGLSVLLVPRIGLPGAAIAASAGALVQHAAIAVLLRARFGFRSASRGSWGWFWSLLVSGAALRWDPPIAGGLALAAVGITGFVWTGRLRGPELRDALRKLRGAR